MARKKYKKIYEYKCTITEEVFKRTAKAENPDELISINAYYDLNPEKDDRPDVIKQIVLAEQE